MTHDEALGLKAPERYVIGDLSEGERDAFEEHFADCSRCTEDVWTLTAFAVNARAVFEERDAQPERSQRGWLEWLQPRFWVPSLAALGLAMAVVYQGAVVIPALRAPRSITHSIILDGATRAAAPQTPAGEPLHFQVAPALLPAGATFWLEVQNASGKTLSSGPVKSPPPEQPLDVYFPLKLDPGRYSLIIRPDLSGRGGEELARSPFEVVAKELKN